MTNAFATFFENFAEERGLERLMTQEKIIFWRNEFNECTLMCAFPELIARFADEFTEAVGIWYDKQPKVKIT